MMSFRIGILMVVSPGESILARDALTRALECAPCPCEVILVNNGGFDEPPVSLRAGDGLRIIQPPNAPRPYFEIARTIFGALQEIADGGPELVFKIDADSVVLRADFFQDVLALHSEHAADFYAAHIASPKPDFLRRAARFILDFLPFGFSRCPSSDRYGRGLQWRLQGVWYQRTALAALMRRGLFLPRQPSGGFYAIAGKCLRQLRQQGRLIPQGKNGLEWNDDTLLPIAVRSAGGRVVDLRLTPFAPGWRCMHGSRYFTDEEAMAPDLRGLHPLKQSPADDLLRQRLGTGVKLLIGLLACGIFPPSSLLAQLTWRCGEKGPASLNYRGVELLASNHRYIEPPQLLDASGKAATAPGEGVTTFSASGWRFSAAWGEVTCAYAVKGDTLRMDVQIANHSAQTLTGFGADLLELRFPSQPRGEGWDKHFLVTGDNVDDFTAAVADYGTAQLVACNEEVASPLRFGFSTPVGPNTYRVQMSGKLWNASGDPTIAPGDTRSFHFTLRFAPEGKPVGELTSDLAARLARAFPARLAWKDRRPLAMIALASNFHQSATNPRGWFSNPQLNVLDRRGAKRFRAAVLEQARTHVSVLKQMNAQGMVVWNIEGDQFPHIAYAGDPRRIADLAPDMDAAADEYFAQFTKAGFRTGVCIRPTRIVPGKGGEPWIHFEDGLDAVTELSSKIDYAQRRWGCTLFYIDTSVHYFRDRENKVTTRLITTAEWQRLFRKHPDVLLIPEFAGTASYSVTAPYHELRDQGGGGSAATPDHALSVFPGAFSIINPVEGRMQERQAELIQGVRRGDVLLFRGFFRDETWNPLIRGIYRAAERH